MMKRNILAVVIPALLAAGAANAAEIYNKDGNKLDLYGKVDARHQFSDDSSSDGDKSYVRFGFKGETQITDQLTGYGQWEYNVQANVAESQGTSGSKTRVGFAGLKFADAGSFDYGRNYGVLYDAMSYTDQLPVFGDDTLYQDNDNFMAGRSNGLATYRNSNFFGLVDGLAFAVQYQGKNEGRGPRYDNGDGWGTSLSYDTGMGISAVGAYFSSDRTNQQQLDGNGEKADAYGFGLKYDANNVYLAAFYGESRNLTQYGNNNDGTGATGPDFNFAANKAQAFEVVAQYQFDFGLRPSIAYLQSKGKDLNGATGHGSTFAGGDADLVKYIEIGTYYYFNKNMSTYVDYKINLLDDNDFTRATGTSTDDVVGVGLVYQF
ncbi:MULTISPECIES: porin OmpC [Pantoea]|nr:MULTISPECIES: porin OmpC [Pantoea]MDI6633292.1 porin OmpC [Pantoea dispersa]MDR6299030.1 outer membrane pore protein F [Pantoea dispersa]PPC70689.1 porin [Pantoea sp. ICBG 828]